MASGFILSGNYFHRVAGFPQTNRHRSTSRIAVAQAMRDGREADAEKLLTNAIRRTRRDRSQDPRLAEYLKSLSQFADRRDSPTDAVALITRAYESTEMPTAFDLRITNDLLLLASHAQMSGEYSGKRATAERGLEIARSNMKNLNSGLEC